jgi:hypothetical protein
MNRRSRWASRSGRNYVVDRFALDPLSLMDPHIEDGGSGRAPILVVPFEGDAALFDQDPRPASMRTAAGGVIGPFAQRHGQALRIELTRTPQLGPGADELVKMRLDPICEGVQAVNAQLERFRDDLRTGALSSLRLRQERARAYRAFLAAASLPVRMREDAPTTFMAPPLQQRPRPELPAGTRGLPAPIPPALATQIFEHILSVLRAAGRAMERSPETYARWGEEDRRQVLLLMLNTHYVGQAYAEAFNGQGKTDLLIRVEDRNLFVGECLMWVGPTKLIEKLEQLFGYSTWDDVRLALVVFVTVRELSRVLDAGRVALEAHESFRSWIADQPEAELRAQLTWPGDEHRRVTLQVLFIHTPQARS